MEIACFGGDARIEATDPDAIVEAFVSHANEAHDWTYPEQALRNYARNVAESIERLTGSDERLTGSDERLDAIGPVTVHAVTEERIDDWLQLFDHDGFAGNAEWASCYCLEPHVPPTDDEPERPWREVRAMMIERLRAGTTYGYLAYVNGAVAGWVNASPRSDYGLYRLVDPEGPSPSDVIGVSCFVIAPPYRRHGVASMLVDRVIADAADRGARWVESYPRNDPEQSDADHFRGPRSIYDARGFSPVVVRERDTVMRRTATDTP